MSPVTYYIQNFTATGRDEAGVIYVLKAERLAHFPIDNTALLDKPHLVQYQEGEPARQTTSESGWMSSDGLRSCSRATSKSPNFELMKIPGASPAPSVSVSDWIGAARFVRQAWFAKIPP